MDMEAVRSLRARGADAKWAHADEPMDLGSGNIGAHAVAADQRAGTRGASGGGALEAPGPLARACARNPGAFAAGAS